MIFLSNIKQRVGYYLKPKSNDGNILDYYCTLKTYNEELAGTYPQFNCGDSDLNEFFTKDYKNYSNDLFGKTYCFIHSKENKIVCIFSVSNDSIKSISLPSKSKKKVQESIPTIKHSIKSYPAVLIGRLGVDKCYKGKNIGKELLDFIKAWFSESKNKTGCRFIVVDAYNKKNVLDFYLKNGFDFLFTSEKKEAEYLEYPPNAHLETRTMYFDLITLSNGID